MTKITMYPYCIAETKATKIGVLEPKADDRHQCGIFSSTAWQPFRAGRVGESQDSPVPLAGTPILHGLPTPIGVGMSGITIRFKGVSP